MPSNHQSTEDQKLRPEPDMIKMFKAHGDFKTMVCSEAAERSSQQSSDSNQVRQFNSILHLSQFSSFHHSTLPPFNFAIIYRNLFFL